MCDVWMATVSCWHSSDSMIPNSSRSLSIPTHPPTRENLYTLNSVATRSEKKEWQFKCDWHRDCWVGVFRRNRMIEWYLPSTSVHLSTAWAVSRWFGGSIFFSPRTVDTDWRYAVWGRGDSYYRWRLRAWNINQRLASLLAMKWSVRGNRWVRRREMETILPPSSDVKSALIALPPPRTQNIQIEWRQTKIYFIRLQMQSRNRNFHLRLTHTQPQRIFEVPSSLSSIQYNRSKPKYNAFSV